jgi:hypothetical protein
MNRRAFGATVAGMVLVTGGRVLAQGGPPPQGQRPRWGQQAEKDFRLGRGLGPQLMTEEEWKEHQQKMRSMTSEDREKYRQEMHQKMLERAKEKGISLPAAPRPAN